MTAAVSIRQRFFRKVEKSDGCWLWLGAKDRNGYGMFSVGSGRRPDGTRRNSMVLAHRVAYEIEFGPIHSCEDRFQGNSLPPSPLSRRLCVLHSCESPDCVNPKHLFLGTNLDSVRKMDAKGRRKTNALRGADHGRAVLTEAHVREIVRRHFDDKVPQRHLAAEFGVAASTVNHIFTGRLWKHLGLIERGAS